MIRKNAHTPAVPAIWDQPDVRKIRWTQAIQLVWVVYALTMGLLMIASLPLIYQQLQTACTGSPCLWGQLSSEGMSRLREVGFPITWYAAYSTVMPLVVPILALSLTTIIVWRKPHDRMALLFALLFGTCPVNLSNMPLALTQSYPEFWLAAKLIEAPAVGFMLFYYLAPDGRFIPSWSKWLLVPILVFGPVAVLTPLIPPDSTAFRLLNTWMGIITIAMFAFQFYRYRYFANVVQRQQIKWILYGSATVVSTNFLTSIAASALPDSMRFHPITLLLQNTLITLAIAIVIVTFWVAVAKARLFDIDILINRTLVYGVLTTCVVGLYVAVVGGLGALFQSQGSLLFSLLATGLIAILFQPLRERLQRAVNRLMYGERDEPYRVLTRLGQRLEAAVEPNAALPLTVETVAHALKLPYVAIKLKQTETLQTVAAYGTVQNEETIFPLVYAGETIGELSAAARALNEPLSPADYQLLQDLARPISVTAHAVLLSADLERARLRIVTAREEARRRLGSDLHDGVGHQLAGLARQVETAVSLLDHNPTTASQLLTNINQQLNVAISQVRHLAHQLHPPELELLGLVGALRERALTHPGLTINLDAPESLPPLPPAAETAAYYIALEAMTNVEKHATSQTCALRLALVDGVLEMEITDNGPGLPTAGSSGLGLLSMQARAAEVGGSCRLETNAGKGTHVIVRLPVHEG